MPITPRFAQAEPNKSVLFDRDKLQEISRLHNEGIPHDMPWDLLLVGLGLTLIAITVISTRRWWLARQNDPSPLVIYSAVARKAGLTWPDRLLLWRVARSCELPTPISLLLSRGALRTFTTRFAQQRSPATQQRLTQRVAKIEAALFE